MANAYGSLSSINTVAQVLGPSFNGQVGVLVYNDPASANTVYYGFSNSVTAGLTNLSNTTADNTNGYLLKAGVETLISRQEFVNALGPAARVDPALLYVISSAAGQRVTYKVI